MWTFGLLLDASTSPISTSTTSRACAQFIGTSSSHQVHVALSRSTPSSRVGLPAFGQARPPATSWYALAPRSAARSSPKNDTVGICRNSSPSLFNLSTSQSRQPLRPRTYLRPPRSTRSRGGPTETPNPSSPRPRTVAFLRPGSVLRCCAPRKVEDALERSLWTHPACARETGGRSLALNLVSLFGRMESLNMAASLTSEPRRRSCLALSG